MKCKVFDPIYFHSKSHFEDDVTKNYLVFYSAYIYFKKIANSNHILVWKPKRLSNESIKPYVSSNKSLAFTLNYVSTKPQVKFDGAR